MINKSGPVRAIRTYVGANSGPYTERQHVFYDRREDITTFLRVHPIPGVMDFFDYSPAASGMTYRNNFNQAGIRINGVPDTPERRGPRPGSRSRARREGSRSCTRSTATRR